ncbi:MAG: ATP-binding protein [Actinomycetota bacterium]
MFESFLAVPLHFTIEFFGFLVALGGALLAFTRPDLVPGHSSNRIAVGLGLTTLAVAQVLHGGSFLVADADPVLVGARALAFAFILIGVSGTLRPEAAAAFLGYDVKDPLPFASAGAALLVAFTALAAARRQGGAAYRRLAAAALLFAVADALTAAAPDATFGGSAFNAFAWSAHGVKFVGFLFLAAWFGSAVRTSIRARFVASFGALLVAVVLSLSTALTGVISNNVASGELDRVTSQVRNAAQSFSANGEETEQLAIDARSLASSYPDVQRGFADSTDPKALAGGILGLELGAEKNFVVVDRVDRLPGVAGFGPFVETRSGESKSTKLRKSDVLAILGAPVVTEVARGRSLSASPTRIGDAVAIVAAARVRAPSELGGDYAGVLVVGRFLDALTVEDISAVAGGARQAPASLMDGEGGVVASELRSSQIPDLRIPAEQQEELRRTGAAAVQQSLGNFIYFTGFADILDGNRRPVATLALSSKATVVTSAREGVTKTLFLAAMIVGIVALFLAWLSGRRITRPIQELTHTARAVREGDLTATAEVVGEDEVGVLGETFNEMTSSLFRMTDDLRAAARQEHDLRARIETIIESMADGLVAVDAERNILAFNREAEHLTSVKAEEALGKPVDEILVAVDAQGAKMRLPIFDLAEGSVGGISLRRKRGERIPVAVTSAVLKDEDESVFGAVAVVRDMTREREIERMKTEFLSNISHELRTPLTPIKGYAEILSRKDVPRDKAKQFMRGILDSTSRLERIVELLVDFSAMEAGRMAPRATQIDLGAIVEDMAGGWREHAPSHEIVIDVAAGSPPVMGDERLIRRCIEEIVDNAIKFSPSGGTVRVAVQASGAESESGGVLLTISDQGIGISTDDLSRIFSDFQQLDGSETRTFGGLGLGLAFVQRIIEAHNGTVQVDSRPNEGTTFTIELPGRGDQAAEAGRGTPGAAEPSDKEEEEAAREGPVEPPAAAASLDG